MVDTVENVISDNSVVIFSKTYCPFCTKVKELFKDLNVDCHVIELDVMGDDGKAMQDKLHDKTGMKTVPNVFVNGNHVGGCSDTYRAHSDGTLLDMLQKTYRKREYDLIVIGGGSGGLAASQEASLLGRKVAVCDFVKPSPQGTSWGLGGTCVNVGCIPKKLMHRAANLGCHLDDSYHFGWKKIDRFHNWNILVEKIQDYIKALNFGYRKSLRERNITYINAYAQFSDPSDPHKITITDKKGVRKEISAQNFIIAVGGRPRYPDIPGAREYGISSDDLFSLPYNPGKTLIVGASYIALECAGFLAGFGINVTVMVRSILLRGFDQQMATMVGDHMSKHGVSFLRNCVPTSVELVKEGSPPLLKVQGRFDDGSEHCENYNTVLFAIGRVACTSDLGLENVGVKVNKSTLKIIGDEREQTSARHIYAIGDVLDGKLELTPVAIKAGRLLAQRLYNGKTILTDYKNVPTAVFTPLEYGCVGLSEEAAIQQYGSDDIEIYHTHFTPLEYELAARDSSVPYAKVICVKSLQEKVVGFHVLSPDAGEVTQGFAIGLKLDAKKSDFDDLLGIHPTCAEVFTSLKITKSSGVNPAKTSC